MSPPSPRRFAKRVLRRLVRPIVGQRTEIVAEAKALREQIDALEGRVEELACVMRDLDSMLKERRE